ncbi:MAG TPA: hypothetical protein VHB79_28760 [Polyangiaceae bacterium]|nr:hypothetical protein [Polyangiaceae bacterium]
MVTTNGTSYRIAGLHGGPLEDRPALASLDATHLLVGFSVGTDPTGSGVYNLPRLRYAVIDTAPGAPAPTVVPLDALDDVLTSDNTVAQLSPSLTTGNEGPCVYRPS